MIGILPWGAYEQHGPFLPLETDTIIATEFADRISQRLEKAVVLPTIPYGVSIEHGGVGDTTYMDYKTAIDMLESVLMSISKNNRFSLVVLLNGHGGNQDIASMVCHNINYSTHGTRFVALHVFPAKARTLAADLFGAFSAHADSVETSVIAELVGGIEERKICLAEYNTKPILRRAIHLYPVKNISPSGIVSKTDYIDINRDKGKTMIDACIEELLEEIMYYEELINAYGIG